MSYLMTLSCIASRMSNTREVLQRLREDNVTEYREKCDKIITFFRHVLSEDGISHGEDGMSVITQASQPTNVEETRSLLGMARYEAGLYLNMGRRNQAFDELKDRMAHTRRSRNTVVKRWSKYNHPMYPSL